MSKLHTDVFSAINALPRPATQEDVLACAEEKLALPENALQGQQFRNWFEQNGAQLVRMLNETA